LTFSTVANSMFQSSPFTPSHLIHFNGARFLGPHPKRIELET